VSPSGVKHQVSHSARGFGHPQAWSASKAPGPLRAFYQRVAARRGMQVAVVAAARKLTVLCWHLIIKGEDYAYAQPSLVAHKRRKLELRAGAPAAEVVPELVELEVAVPHLSPAVR
jgi:hypothetical protein